MWIQLLTSLVDEAKKKPAVVENLGFFLVGTFLIQENVSDCSQFEATLQLLQDFFSHSLKIRKNKSVTTSKHAICSKLRHFFFEDSIAFAMLRRKKGVKMGLVNHIPYHFDVLVLALVVALSVDQVHLKP